MDKNVIRFVELCARSRYGGLTVYENQEKKDLVDRLVEDGLMKNEGVYWFVDPDTREYFGQTIKNWNKK